MRKLKWVLMNAALVAVIVAGFTFGIEGARNVLQFYVMFLLLVGLLMNSDCGVKVLASMGKPVFNGAVNFYFNLFIALYLSWYGALTLATMFLFSRFFVSFAWSKAAKRNEEAA